MRREVMEYDYDWNMWTIMENASKSHDGTLKEYKILLEQVPHFRGVLDAIIRHGEPGILLLKMIADYLKNIVTAHERGKKVAFTTYCYAPPILYAMDMVPLSVEPMTVFGTFILERGTAEYLDYSCEVGFTETSCSAQRGALGAYLAGLGVKPDLVVCDSAGICDTNANSFAFASAYLDIPFFQLDYPPTLTDDRASLYQREDFRKMISFIEEHTGNKLDQDRLKQILLEIRRQDELISELTELQTIVPNPVPVVYILFMYGGNFLMGGTMEYTKMLEYMVDKAKENADKGIAGTASGKEKARGLFCYIDHYTTDLRFWDWLDNNDISHLGSILSLFWQDGAAYSVGKEDETYKVDPTNLDTMLDSLADLGSRRPMVKSIRGPYDAPGMWLDDTLGAAKLLKADFVVYIGTIGCRNTWGMVKLLANDLEREGIPTLVLYADAFDDRVQSWEAVVDKMNEFLHLRKIIE